MAAVCDIIPRVLTREGKFVDSELFPALLARGLKREEALAVYQQVFTKGFKDKFGDWTIQKLDNTYDSGEPRIEATEGITPDTRRIKSNITTGEIEKKGQSIEFALADDNAAYRDKFGNVYKRLTEFISEGFSKMKFSPFEEAANREFEKQRLTKQDVIQEGDEKYTYEEFVKHLEMRSNTFGKVYGKLAHLYIEKEIRPSSEVEQEIERLQAGIPGESYPISADFFTWIPKNIKSIFRETGINYLEDNISEADRDTILPEVKIFSTLMGIGTAADTLVRHADGTYSMPDWKTGSKFFDDSYTNRFMKYGDQVEDIRDNKESRAKLELMLRAVILKEQYDSNIKFRSLNVVHLTKKRIEVMNVDVKSYLGMIESYYRDPANGKTDVYQSMKDRGIFDASNYLASNRDLEDVLSDAPASARIEKMLTELRMVNNRIQGKSAKEVSRDDLVAREELVKNIAFLSGDTSANGTEQDVSDMSWWKKVFGNKYSIHNPLLKSFFKLLDKRKNRANNRIQELEKEHDEKLLPIIKKYFQDNGIQGSFNTVTRGLLNGLQYQDLYDFMWEEKPGRGKFSRIITEQDVSSGVYTREQYDYNKWYRETLTKLYSEVANKPALTEFGKTFSKAELMKLPSSLPEDFMPRVPMNFEEVVERHGVLSKEAAQYQYDSYLSGFTEEMYKGTDTKYGVPIKFMESPKIVGANNYTYSTEIAFKGFIKNLILKDELDDTYSLGTAMKNLLKEDIDKDGNLNYKNTVDFLESQIQLHVLDTKNPTEFTRKKFRAKIGSKEVVLSPERIMRTTKSWISASSMWLKFPAGVANTALITILNHKDSVKGSIAKAFGIPEEDIDYTYSDLLSAQKEYGTFIYDIMRGAKEENKLWLMAKKFNFLPDNYDYATKKSDLLGVKNKALDQANLYLFHSIGEEFGNLALLGAQMKHYKVGSKSAWDSYEVQNGELVYTGDRKGKLEDGSEITELTSQEITKLKRVSARIHGGYRQEERTSLELHAMGQWALQFRKYLPNILENLLQSKYEDVSLGKYVVSQNEAGEDVYQWVGRINEGRIRVLIAFMQTVLKLRTDPDYKWENLSNEQKQHLIDLLVSGLTYGAMGAAYAAMFDDDDEKNPYAIRFHRMMDDSTQGLAFWDILNSLQSQTIVLPKIYKASVAMNDMLFNGVILGKRTKKDDSLPGLKVLGNTFPLMSSINDLNRYLEVKEANISRR